MNKQLINFTEAQKQLGVSRSTLLRWLKAKRITGYKAGKKWKFYPEDLSKVLLKESPAIYIKNDNKDLIKVLKTLLPEKIQKGDIYSPGFWCEWQDISQWVMITLYFKDSYAQIELINNELDNTVKKLKISLSNAAAINQIWNIWDNNSVNNPPRSGKYCFISGTNGYKISTLQLPANIKPTTEKNKMSKNNENKIDNADFFDVYVYGPPGRQTALTAYSILSKLILKKGILSPTVLTSEREPTYYIPGALQIYEEDPKNIPVTQFSLSQSNTSDLMPSRGIRSSTYRISYSFGKRNNLLKESDNELIIE